MARLDASDAKLVDVLHTSSGSNVFDPLVGRYGMDESIGHLDFYANGGRMQPGCQISINDITNIPTDSKTFFLCNTGIGDVAQW